MTICWSPARCKMSREYLNKIRTIALKIAMIEQDTRCRQNVSAETSEVEQDLEHDAEWHRQDEEGTFYLSPSSIIE